MARPWDQSCSVWATVACPNRHVEHVRAWVARRCDQWGVDEMHARGTRTTRALTSRERHEVCAFVGTGDLLWEATVVDSLMVSAADLAARQLKQQKQFRKDWARSNRARSTDPSDVALRPRVPTESVRERSSSRNGQRHCRLAREPNRGLRVDAPVAVARAVTAVVVLAGALVDPVTGVAQDLPYVVPVQVWIPA